MPNCKAGDLGAVAKLKDTRTNDTLADKAPASPSRRSTFPEPVLSYAIEPKSRGDEDKISTSMHRLEEEDGTIRYARDPADQRAAARRTGPAAHRGHRRQAEAALRRRSEPQATAHPLSRDDHRARRGARPPQEADRRARAVRRLQDPHGAAAARQRVRVRRRDLRRLDPAAVHSRRREGDPRVTAARLPGRLSRSWISASCSLDGQYHDVDSNELSFKTAGWLAFKDGMSKAKPDAPRAGDERRGLRAERLRRRPDGRPERTPRAHLGHGAARPP